MTIDRHLKQLIISTKSIELMQFIRSNKGVFVNLIVYLCSCFIIVGGLLLSTTISGYNKYNLDNPVDRNNCICNCWDGYYRGIHGRGAVYKAFYFNYDVNMVKIISLFVLYMCLLMFVLRKCFKLMIYEIGWQVMNKLNRIRVTDDDCYIKLDDNNNEIMSEIDGSLLPITSKYHPQLRVFVFLTLAVSIYSHYYGVWAFINYLNDRDNRMFNSQLFYIVTELVPSYIYYIYVNRYHTIKSLLIENEHKYLRIYNFYNKIQVTYIWPVMYISLLHIFLALPEGMLSDFIWKNDEDNERRKAIKFRDLALMLNDFFGLLFSFYYLCKNKRHFSNMNNNNSYYNSNLTIYKTSKLTFIIWFFLTIVLYFIYNNYCLFKN